MTLCGFEIAPGEKRQVKLPVPGGAPLEAWLLCGAHPGKTLVVTAGVHGCEYVGILALQKLAETLDCATLFGQVILLPLVNSKGFFAGVKQLNPADGRNLNREFPGKADGTETQRMAWTIEKLLYPEADFLLDLHGGDWNEELAPLVFFPCGAEQNWSRRPAGRHRLFRFPCGSVQQPKMDCIAGQHKKESLLCCWSEAEMAAGLPKRWKQIARMYSV